ncbi:MAG: hypothetical protein ACKO37_03740 [Vampirovibrionales bacterium]
MMMAEAQIYTRFGRPLSASGTTRNRASGYVYYPTSIGVLNTTYAQGLTRLQGVRASNAQQGLQGDTFRSTLSTQGADPQGNGLGSLQSVGFSTSPLLDTLSGNTLAQRYFERLNPSLEGLSLQEQRLLRPAQGLQESLSQWSTQTFSGFQSQLQQLLRQVQQASPW